MIELTLQGMTCGHCVKAVTQTVQQLDPQAKVEVDLPTGRVRIDSQALAAPAQREALREALAEEGYPAVG